MESANDEVLSSASRCLLQPYSNVSVHPLKKDWYISR